MMQHNEEHTMNTLEVSDDYVAEALFPTEIYASQQETAPPTLWAEPMPVRVLEADNVTFNTYAVPSSVDQPASTLILARRGNNERKRATIKSSGQPLALFADPVQGPIPITISGATFFPNAYVLAVGETFIYEAVAPLYCLSLGATTTHSIVSVMSEGYFRNR